MLCFVIQYQFSKKLLVFNSYFTNICGCCSFCVVYKPPIARQHCCNLSLAIWLQRNINWGKDIASVNTKNTCLWKNIKLYLLAYSITMYRNIFHKPSTVMCIVSPVSWQYTAQLVSGGSTVAWCVPHLYVPLDKSICRMNKCKLFHSDTKTFSLARQLYITFELFTIFKPHRFLTLIAKCKNQKPLCPFVFCRVVMTNITCKYRKFMFTVFLLLFLFVASQLLEMWGGVSP